VPGTAALLQLLRLLCGAVRAPLLLLLLLLLAGRHARQQSALLPELQADLSECRRDTQSSVRHRATTRHRSFNTAGHFRAPPMIT